MMNRKISDASAEAETQPTPPVSQDQAQAGGAPEAPPPPPAPTEPPTIPDPIVAVGEDGHERPMSGGSFVRMPDGKLVRSDD